MSYMILNSKILNLNAYNSAIINADNAQITITIIVLLFNECVIKSII